MKKLFLVLLLIAGVFISVSAEETKDAAMEQLTLKTGSSISVLLIGTDMFINTSLENDSYAPTITEIFPVNNTYTKMVLAVPVNRAGAHEYHTLYVKKGDILSFRKPYSASITVAACIDSAPNVITLLSRAKN